MPGLKWRTIFVLIGMTLNVSSVRAVDGIEGFCGVAKHPQPFFGKAVKFRALLVHPRSGSDPLNGGDNLIVTSAACPDQGLIADAKSLLANASKERRFELVGKLIGGELALYEVEGTIQAPSSPNLMAKLIPTSVRPASGRPAH